MIRKYLFCLREGDLESKNKKSFASSRFRYFLVVSPISGTVSPLNETNWKCDKWLKWSFRTIIYYLLGFRDCWRLLAMWNRRFSDFRPFFDEKLCFPKVTWPLRTVIIRPKYSVGSAHNMIWVTWSICDPRCHASLNLKPFQNGMFNVT